MRVTDRADSTVIASMSKGQWAQIGHVLNLAPKAAIFLDDMSSEGFPPPPIPNVVFASGRGAINDGDTGSGRLAND